MTTGIRVALLDSDVVAVEGKDRVDLLQRLSTGDLRPLAEVGRVRSTVFTTDKGRVVDWCWLVSAPERLLCLTSAGRGESVRSWIDKYTIMEDVQTEALGAWKHVALFGGAVAALRELAALPSDDALPPQGEAAPDHGGWWFSGLAAYGPRLEGVLPGAEADAVLARALEAGASPVGAPELERLRVLAGVPSPHHEFEQEVNPLELRMHGSVSWNKGCYVGQEVISRLDSYDKVARFLMGWEARGPFDPARMTGRIRAGGKTLGRVTTVIPDADGGVMGLAVVGRDAARPGQAEIELEDGAAPIELLDRPFWA